MHCRPYRVARVLPNRTAPQATTTCVCWPWELERPTDLPNLIGSISATKAAASSNYGWCRHRWQQRQHQQSHQQRQRQSQRHRHQRNPVPSSRGKAAALAVCGTMATKSTKCNGGRLVCASVLLRTNRSPLCRMPGLPTSPNAHRPQPMMFFLSFVFVLYFVVLDARSASTDHGRQRRRHLGVAATLRLSHLPDAAML